MSKAFVVAIIISTCVAEAGYAQPALAGNSLALPGSLWISLATTDESEPGNVVGQAGLEQGLVVWQQKSWFLVPFVGIGLTQDTKGYEWNDKQPSTVGVKLSRHFPVGVLNAGGGMIVEHDPATGERYHPMAFAQIWTGWQGDGAAQRGRGSLTYPGSAWVHSGIVTGRDPKNWVTSAAVQQGIRVYHKGGVAAVPFAGAAATVDTERRAWENKVHYEAGVKAIRAFVGGVVEAGAAMRKRHRLVAHDVESGPVGFVNFWIGWNPRVW